MKSRDYARALAEGLRNREIESVVIEEFVRCVNFVHATDEFVGPLARKLLGRHARRSGPRGKTRAEKVKIAKAALVARGWRRRLGKDGAAKLAAQEFKLEFYDVYRAAFERKDRWARELMRSPK